MNLISNLFVSDDRCLVIWMNGNCMIRKVYSYPVIAVCFTGNERVLIIEPEGANQKFSNAAIYNSDGTEFDRIVSPIDQTEFICFSDAYYVKGQLNLFFMSRNIFYKCIVDKTGRVSDINETR